MTRGRSTALGAALSVTLALAAGWRLGWTEALPAYVYLAAVTGPLTVIDLREHRLPNSLTLPSYPVVGALLLVPAVAASAWDAFGRALLAALALLVGYLVLHVVNPAGMGFGDVKLAGPLGALLGWLSWSHVLWGTVTGFVLAAVVGISLIAAGRATRRTALPFGPFMLAGAWAVILLGVPGA